MSIASLQFKDVIILTVLITLLGTSALFYPKIYAQINTPPTLSGTTFPPPIFYQLRNIPSYAITIPFNSLGKSPFEPAEINIPAGMTVIWFNDDIGEHSVTTLANSSHSKQVINSGPIPPNGGSFIHMFSKPGVYDYNDKFDPSMHGRVAVGTDMVATKNINMLIGGLGILFNPKHAQRVVLSFIPKTISIPPTIALTYQVTIVNPVRPWLSFTHAYDTADGVLDLELVPTHKPPSSPTKVTSGFITWGPDFRSQEGLRTTGTYHIKGPVLVDPSEYDIRIAIVAKDNKILPNPIVSTFIFLPNSATISTRTS